MRKISLNIIYKVIKKYKLQNNYGFGAMFSFLIMITVFGILIVSFTGIVMKNIFTTRVFSVNIKNTYAIEGFIDDTLRRGKYQQFNNVLDEENLSFDDITVNSVLYEEDNLINYIFSANTADKFFKKEMLTIEKLEKPSLKIRSWHETQ